MDAERLGKLCKGVSPACWVRTHNRSGYCHGCLTGERRKHQHAAEPRGRKQYEPPTLTPAEIRGHSIDLPSSGYRRRGGVRYGD